jgi:hypothetical protein
MDERTVGHEARLASAVARRDWPFAERVELDGVRSLRERVGDATGRERSAVSDGHEIGGDHKLPRGMAQGEPRGSFIRLCRG